MGLFNGYMKEGPGVSKNAPEKHRFFLFFELFGRKFTKLIRLNMMMFVCLLPLALGIYMSVSINPQIISNGEVFTENISKMPLFIFSGDIVGMAIFVLSILLAAPAMAGFTYVIRNFQREEHAWVFSDFKDNFKSNFKQAVALGFIDALVYLLMYVAFVFYRFQMPVINPGMAKITPILTTLIIVMSMIYTWMHYYIYVMMVTFDLKLKDLFRNSLLFAIGKLPLNILITIICGAIVFFSFYYIAVGAILSFVITLSLLGYIVVFSVYPTIDSYLIEPVTIHDETDDEERTFSDDREE